MKVLDLGCGLGGPARTICQETGCDIIGITNNDWLVARGTELNRKYGLDHKIKLQVAEFLVCFPHKEKKNKNSRPPLSK